MNRFLEEEVSRRLEGVWKAPTPHQAQAVKDVMRLLYNFIESESIAAEALGVYPGESDAKIALSLGLEVPSDLEVKRKTTRENRETVAKAICFSGEEMHATAHFIHTGEVLDGFTREQCEQLLIRGQQKNLEKLDGHMNIKLASHLFKIQHATFITPLRFFWKELARDESIFIRAAAKGNLEEQGHEFTSHDDIEEIRLMGDANITVTRIFPIYRVLWGVVQNNYSLETACQLWEVIKMPISFVPRMEFRQVHVL